MPAVVRVGDMSAGHPHCYPPTPAVSGSPDVFVNGKAAVRVGDSWATHGACPVHSPHSGSSSSGSSSVFVNGKALCRVGDSISCGDTMAQGSPNVFAGG
jgi:uncharacterized Zn-binding protein involved in type VI secretion